MEQVLIGALIILIGILIYISPRSARTRKNKRMEKYENIRSDHVKNDKIKKSGI